MKPIIKWVGGKRRFFETISKNIPSEYKNYFEPFAGSAAVMFELEPKGKIYINDINPNLINFYKVLRDEPVKLRNEIVSLINSGVDFYEVRDDYNSTISNPKDKLDFTEAVRFFYLNKMAFNGLYRVNLSGKYNTPEGRFASGPHIPEENEFVEISKILKRSTITNGHWKDSLNKVKDGDLIYLDPPYYVDDSSSFVGYSNPIFGHEQHVEMVATAKEKVDLGAVVLISNSNSTKFEEILSQYFGEEFKLIRIPTKRSINPNSKDKDKFIETLYVLGGEKW